MFKLVVGALLVSFACAAPGIVGHYPGAVSHVSRVDVHDSKPIIAGYGAPYGYESVGAYAPYPVGHYGGYAPGGYAPGGYAPGGYAAGHYGYPAAHSYSNRIDVHSAAVPVVTPALGYGQGYGQGYGLGYGHGNGYGIHDGSGFGYPVHGYGIQGLHHGY